MLLVYLYAKCFSLSNVIITFEYPKHMEINLSCHGKWLNSCYIFNVRISFKNMYFHWCSITAETLLSEHGVKEEDFVHKTEEVTQQKIIIMEEWND